jgi:hypothetical protein
MNFSRIWAFAWTLWSWPGTSAGQETGQREPIGIAES